MSLRARLSRIEKALGGRDDFDGFDASHVMRWIEGPDGLASAPAGVRRFSLFMALIGYHAMLTGPARTRRMWERCGQAIPPSTLQDLEQAEAENASILAGLGMQAGDVAEFIEHARAAGFTRGELGRLGRTLRAQAARA